MAKKNSQIMQDGGELKRELGIWAATAIVVGNVIGSGVFMSPGSMARATNPKVAIIAWILTAVGSL
ncbi:MAG: amino acid permease, partial [Clostridium sp.]